MEPELKLFQFRWVSPDTSSALVAAPSLEMALEVVKDRGIGPAGCMPMSVVCLGRLEAVVR